MEEIFEKKLLRCIQTQSVLNQAIILAFYYFADNTAVLFNSFKKSVCLNDANNIYKLHYAKYSLLHYDRLQKRMKSMIKYDRSNDSNYFTFTKKGNRLYVGFNPNF